jgi:3-deoxy-7-phosphoheptulonate synthase
MLRQIDDFRINTVTALASPAEMMRAHPATLEAGRTVAQARREVRDVLHGRDDRLIVVIGPCSIHDSGAALDYAGRLAGLRGVVGDALLLVMRVYFEKPRTTVGWKGFLNDPFLDGSFRIEQGLRLARQLLVDINTLGVPAGCEFLNIATPYYISDLVSWGAIGARTTESQIHRELASGLPCAVGFKNGTNGAVGPAIDAMLAAASAHHCLALAEDGRAAMVATMGNADGHVILRGGSAGPNYDAGSVAAAAAAMRRAGLPARVMIDASHGNSGKDFARQPAVIADVAGQIAAGAEICGVMIESHLQAGRQDFVPGTALAYGQSITDGCLGWEDSENVLHGLAEAVRERRRKISLTNMVNLSYIDSL